MKLIIGADLVPTKSNEFIFAKGEVTKLVGNELAAVLHDADYRIFNLEVPLTNIETPIQKCGPALMASTESINGYKSIGVDCVTIANNHIMDQGMQGFASTIKTLKENHIEYVGCGENYEEASKGKIINLHSKKIGIYACVEHEFSIVSDDVPGANPFEPLVSLDHISMLKDACDYVIVLYHGGKEHYRYPSPNLQKSCRKMIDKGANLVLCQHSHCIGCEERYGEGTIVYGQGNFLFDYQDNEFWQTGLLVEITDDFKIDYIPVCKDGNAVRLANKQESELIMSGFRQRSNEILCDGLIDEKYTCYAKSMLDNYLLSLLGVNRRSFIFRIANRITRGRASKRLINHKYKSSNFLSIQNIIECEAHRELILKGIKNQRG